MKNNYTNNYDSESDSLWITFKDGPEAYFEEVVPGINLEFDDKSQLIGIEILNYAQKMVDYSTQITDKPLISPGESFRTEEDIKQFIRRIIIEEKQKDAYQLAIDQVTKRLAGKGYITFEELKELSKQNIVNT